MPDPAAGRDGSAPPPPAVEPPLPIAPPPEIADAGLRAASAADADRETAARLSERLRARAPLTAEDVRAAEDLYARYPAPARDLLEGVLIGAAAGHREGRRYDAAAALLDRAQAVAPASPRVPRALLGLSARDGRLGGRGERGARPAGPRRFRRGGGPRPGLRPRAPGPLARGHRAPRRFPRPAPRPRDPSAPGAVPARPGLGSLARRGAPRAFPRALRRRRARGRRPRGPAGPRSALRDAGADLRPPAGRAHPGHPAGGPELLRRDRRAGVVGRPVRLLRRPRAPPHRGAERLARRPSSTTRSCTSSRTPSSPTSRAASRRGSSTRASPS